MLGGNQSDSVSLAWIAKSRLLEARWPSTVAHTETGAFRVADRTEPLSRNEA